MSEAEKKRFLNEAVGIFLHLCEAPDDPKFLARKAAFLARGKTEREAYAKIVEGWTVSGARRKPRSLILIRCFWGCCCPPILLPTHCASLCW
ncbi:hypothetical protein [uncultured Roseovarius sp.]|uniref:hypothetical protein n=1 Tax=uncultured Roseovarius sp. TaxID=293344 RepID=UPI00260F0D17|nr:hypothetical protein [uncultured Roseovarius sp.]